MARPTTIQNETILTAARELFLERGVQATTSELASRAGVSEGTLFKRFGSKERLLRAAVEGYAGEIPWMQGVQESVGKGDIEQNLVMLAERGIQFFRSLIPLLMQAWSAGDGVMPLSFRQPNPPPLRALRTLSAYLDAEMSLGRLRRVDPELAARAFMGSLMHYAFFELFMHGHTPPLMAVSVYAKRLVGLLWGGLMPVPLSARRRMR